MNEVLGVGGSPRKDGNSDILLKSILLGASEAGMSVAGVHLRDYHFHPCSGCERCRKTGKCDGHLDGMQLLYPRLLEAKGLVLVSPTHNYNVTAWMKAFIDRLYCFYVFAEKRPGPWHSRLQNQGRKAVIGAVCELHEREGMGFTLEAMRLPLEALGYEVVGELPVFGIYARGAVAEAEHALDRARTLGKHLAVSLGR